MKQMEKNDSFAWTFQVSSYKFGVVIFVVGQNKRKW